MCLCRKSLHTMCCRVHEELEARLSNIDAYMSDYIAKHANRLFKGKQMTDKPLLQLKEDYPALLRAQINTSGSKACKFWTPQYGRCDPPQNLRECGLIPIVCFRSLWIMCQNAESRWVSRISCATRATKSARFLQENAFLA